MKTHCGTFTARLPQTSTRLAGGLISACCFRASVLPFQKCVNSISGFANSVFYRFIFAKFRFLPFQIFKIPFHFFQAVFLLSIIFVFKIVSVSAF